MPQAFSAPSAEAYKEARAQAVPDATSMGPAAPLGSKEQPSHPPRGSPGLTAEHMQLWDCQWPMSELLDKRVRMDKLMRPELGILYIPEKCKSHRKIKVRRSP